MIMNLIWVTEARYENDYKIKLFFNDGVSGIVDLKNSIKGKVFEPLKDIDYFKNFTNNSWTIEWENGADFAPEYLYSMIVRTKEIS
nr:DUF2442 domain-containing protein [Bacteroidota bacterium]